MLPPWYRTAPRFIDTVFPQFEAWRPRWAALILAISSNRKPWRRLSSAAIRRQRFLSAWASAHIHFMRGRSGFRASRDWPLTIEMPRRSATTASARLNSCSLETFACAISKPHVWYKNVSFERHLWTTGKMGLGCRNHQADNKLSVSAENCSRLSSSDRLEPQQPDCPAKWGQVHLLPAF